MIVKEESFELISQEIIKTHLELTALIQDIKQCTGPLQLLNDLNADGREKIAKLRNNIEKLRFLAERERETTRKADLLSHIDNYKGQLTTAITAFRKANVFSACAIDKKAREELLPTSASEQSLLRKRRDKQGAANVSSQITNHLLDISKYLAETSQRSAETLDTLVTSSDKVSTTRKELEHQQQVIQQSGKLLGKYGRREITDKALVILAFIFFLAVVFYILQKRLL
ncbi:hypothetical protein TSAR_011218 [Trichomalopsis sarcophagae]|uniref:Sec20 C-terminal domain-containing protein n=1 Tax=Trichomalopsis sarcophagae TaxID=543379 RepID=A0A232EEM1_9HYME|nr:hypothetical protein TSAR_011218 [Trichomalopsis sarcophagae]